MTPTVEIVQDALREVIDPEVGLNIVDLGLIYDIAIGEKTVSISMTMTTPSCPMGSMLQEEAAAALESVLPEDWHADVAMVWEPPWSPERLSDAARARMGW